MNPYGYCFQNPLKYIDPTGMEGEEPDPPKKNWFGRAWETIKGWFGYGEKNKAKVECGEGKWSFILGSSAAVESESLVAPVAAETLATGASSSALGALALPLLATGDTGNTEGQTYFYRNMKPDGSFIPDPLLGQSANTLGIRPSDVGGRSFDEIISPTDNQGLSVTIGVGTYKSDSVTPQSIPNYVRGKTTLWRLNPIDLIPLGLIGVPQISPPGYYRITPLYNMTIQTFHEKIQLTQNLWHIAPSNRN